MDLDSTHKFLAFAVQRMGSVDFRLRLKTYVAGFENRTTEEQCHYSAKLLLERAAREGGLKHLEPMVKDMCHGMELASPGGRRQRVRLMTTALQLCPPSPKMAKAAVAGLVMAVRAETASHNDKEFCHLAHQVTRGIIFAAKDAAGTRQLSEEEEGALGADLEGTVVGPLAALLRSPDRPAQSRAAQCLEASLVSLADETWGLRRRVSTAALQAALRAVAAAQQPDKAASGDVFLPMSRALEYLGTACGTKQLQGALQLALGAARTAPDWKSRANAVDLVCVALGACAEAEKLVAIAASLDSRYTTEPLLWDEEAVRSGLAQLEAGLAGPLGTVLDLLPDIDAALRSARSDRVSQVRVAAGDALAELALWMDLSRSLEEMTRRRARHRQQKLADAKRQARDPKGAAGWSASVSVSVPTSVAAQPPRRGAKEIEVEIREPAARPGKKQDAEPAPSSPHRPAPVPQADLAPAAPRGPAPPSATEPSRAPPAPVPAAASSSAPSASKPASAAASAARAAKAAARAKLKADSDEAGMQGWVVEPDDLDDVDFFQSTVSSLLGGGDDPTLPLPGGAAPWPQLDQGDEEGAPSLARSPSRSSEVPDLLPSQAREAAAAADGFDDPSGPAQDGGGGDSSSSDAVEYWRRRAAARKAGAAPGAGVVPRRPGSRRRGAGRTEPSPMGKERTLEVEIHIKERDPPLGGTKPSTGSPRPAGAGASGAGAAASEAPGSGLASARGPGWRSRVVTKEATGGKAGGRRRVTRAEEAEKLLHKAAKLQDKGKAWEIYTVEGVLRPRDFLGQETPEPAAQKQQQQPSPSRRSPRAAAPNSTASPAATARGPAPGSVETLVHLAATPVRGGARGAAAIVEFSPAPGPSTHPAAAALNDQIRRTATAQQQASPGGPAPGTASAAATPSTVRTVAAHGGADDASPLWQAYPAPDSGPRTEVRPDHASRGLFTSEPSVGEGAWASPEVVPARDPQRAEPQLLDVTPQGRALAASPDIASWSILSGLAAPRTPPEPRANGFAPLIELTPKYESPTAAPTPSLVPSRAAAAPYSPGATNRASPSWKPAGRTPATPPSARRGGAAESPRQPAAASPVAPRRSPSPSPRAAAAAALLARTAAASPSWSVGSLAGTPGGAAARPSPGSYSTQARPIVGIESAIVTARVAAGSTHATPSPVRASPYAKAHDSPISTPQPPSSARRKLELEPGSALAPQTASPAVSDILGRLERLEAELQGLSDQYGVAEGAEGPIASPTASAARVREAFASPARPPAAGMSPSPVRQYGTATYTPSPLAPRHAAPDLSPLISLAKPDGAGSPGNLGSLSPLPVGSTLQLLDTLEGPRASSAAPGASHLGDLITFSPGQAPNVRSSPVSARPVSVPATTSPYRGTGPALVFGAGSRTPVAVRSSLDESIGEVGWTGERGVAYRSPSRSPHAASNSSPQRDPPYMPGDASAARHYPRSPGSAAAGAASVNASYMSSNPEEEEKEVSGLRDDFEARLRDLRDQHLEQVAGVRSKYRLGSPGPESRGSSAYTSPSRPMREGVDRVEG